MKPGIRTTELWLTIIASALIGFGAVPVPDKFKFIPISAMVVGYAISRGLAKYEHGDSFPIFGAELPDEAVDPVAEELAAQQAQVEAAEAAEKAAKPKPKRSRAKKGS